MPAAFSPTELLDAIDYADERMGPVRQLRRDAIREYGGRYWYEDDRVKRPLNLLQRGIKVLAAHLSARNPTYEAKTERLALRGTARKLSKQLDMRATKAGMAKFGRLTLMDAFFGGRAVVRIGERSTSEAVRNGDRFVHRGEVYRRLVSIDDWGCDPAARNENEFAYEYEKYRMPRAKAIAAVEQGIFGYDATVENAETPPLDDVATPDEAMEAIKRAPGLADGRTVREDSDRSDDLTAGGLSDEQRYGLIDTIECIDVAIYEDAETCILVTLLADGGAEPKYLRAEIWDGPSRGPFEHVEFDPIPDNPHGPSVASGMREQSDIANSVIGKMVEQIERTRRVLVYRKERASDALKITKTKDGGSVGIDGPVADLKDVDLGGLSPELAPFAQLVIGYWNMQGSFDVLGGATGGPQRTATEDSRLGVAASILVDSLADLWDDFQNRIAQHEAWYLMNDPFIVAPLTMRLPGGYQVEVTYDALQRQGTFNDFSFTIKPRSMQRMDPNVRSQRILELVGAVIQAAEVEAQTGRIDGAAVARILGREFDIEELDEILRDPILGAQIEEVYAGAGMPQPQGTPGMQYPGMDQMNYGARPRSGGVGAPRLASGAAQRSSTMQQAYSPAFRRAS